MQKPLFNRLSLLIIFALVNWLAAISNADAQSAIDPRFGAVEAFWAPNEAAALGIGWERILFYWSQLQPFGPEDWNTLHVADEWLAEARNQGRTVVGLLKNTPTWATDSGYAAGVPRGLYLPADDPANLWAAYVRKVTSYYGPRGVNHWIIWNEPDIAPNVYGHEFGGSIEDYYQLLKTAYQVIKQVDPSATVHLGGLTYWHDPSFLRRFLRVVVADPEAAANNFFFDVISLHIYFRPETVPLIVSNAFGVQREVGITPFKAVWINETNARPSMDPEWPVQVQAFHVDLEQQAWYIVQAYALGFYSGAARIAVYKLVDINMSPGDESWGLVRPHDFSKRPAYFAYQNTIKYLSGFSYPLQREQTTNYTIVSFPRQQGLTRVLWARNPMPVSINVPALAVGGMLINPITDEKIPVMAVNGFYSVNLEGARCHVECLMGGPPVFLVEEGVTVDTVPTAVPRPLPATTVTASPVITVTATAIPTVVPNNTSTPILTATNTATPSATNTPTPTPTPTKIATSTATSILEIIDKPVGSIPTEVAINPSESNITSTPTNTVMVESQETEERTSWWFLGAGGLLGFFLLLLFWKRR